MRFMRVSSCLLFGLLMTVVGSARAQVNPTTDIRWPLITGLGTPTTVGVSCTAANYGQPYQDRSVTPNGRYHCGTDGWEVDNFSKPSVVCGGVNDTAALQAALNAGGYVTTTGNCVLGSTSGHLTIGSNTIWDGLNSTTITYNPSSDDYILGNSQIAQVPNRTCTDVVLTPGSDTITSATCNFTQADVGTESIDCVGGYAGGLAFGGPPVGSTDWHTTIAAVNSTTSATLSDPPSAASNPTTCKIISRDHDITVKNLNLLMQGGAPAEYGFGIWMVSTNRLHLENIYACDGSCTVPTGVGHYNFWIMDSDDFVFKNLTVRGWVYAQDGLHMVGPIKSGVVDGVFGTSGDDMVALAAADGNYYPNTEMVYGVISGVSISNVVGGSVQSHGVAVSGATPISYSSGAPIPVRNIRITHVIGAPYTCTACTGGSLPFGFNYAVGLEQGQLDKIIVDDVGGNIGASAVQISTYAGGDITLRHIGQTLSAYNGLMNPVGSGEQEGLILIPPPGSTWNIVINNLKIEDLQTSLSNTPTMLAVWQGAFSTTTLINTLDIDGMNMWNMTGGLFAPIYLEGSLNHLKITNSSFDFNSSTAMTAIVFLGGGVQPASIDLVNDHLIQESGAAAAGALFYEQSQLTGTFTATDVSYVAASSTSGDTLISFPNGTSSTGQIIINGAVVNNIGNFLYTSIFTPANEPVVANVTATNLGTPTSLPLSGSNANETANIAATGTVALNSYNGALNSLYLTGNTTLTIANGSPGAAVTVTACQASSGGPYTLTWPSNWLNGFTISTTANQCTTQTAIYGAFGAYLLDKWYAPVSFNYPAAGIPNSTGSAWGGSYTVGTSANDIPQLTGSGYLPTAIMPGFTGDMTSSNGGVATTVVKVNGGSIPASACNVGTNSSSQFTANTCTGIGTVFALATGPTFNSANFTGSTDFTASYITPSGTATSGANYNSYSLNFYSSVWNGSAINDDWSMTNVVGTGTNPTSTLTFAHPSGSTGVASVSIPFPTVLTSLAGTGTATVSGGSALSNFSSVGCASGHVCDSLSGDWQISGGDVGLTTATLMTINLPGTRTNKANCVVSILPAAGNQGVGATDMTVVTTSGSSPTIVIGENSVSQDFQVDITWDVFYNCGGN